MKNKIVAILGVASYLLGVLSSATDLEGNSTSSTALLAASSIATVTFHILVVVCLWRSAKAVSLLLAVSSVAMLILSLPQIVGSPSYGSPIIVTLNVFKVIHFIALAWAIIKLFTLNSDLARAESSRPDAGAKSQ